jgi:hypothetical protein
MRQKDIRKHKALLDAKFKKAKRAADNVVDKRRPKDEYEAIQDMVDEGGPSYSEQLMDDLEPIPPERRKKVEPKEKDFKRIQRTLLDLNADGEEESEAGVFDDS